VTSCAAPIGADARGQARFSLLREKAAPLGVFRSKSQSQLQRKQFFALDSTTVME
jgi:hypothetical protein